MKELKKLVGWTYEGIDHLGHKTFKYVCKNGDILKAFKYPKGWVLTSTFAGQTSPSCGQFFPSLKKMVEQLT